MFEGENGSSLGCPSRRGRPPGTKGQPWTQHAGHRDVVVGGVDLHSDTHEAAALDDRGTLLGSATFAGYAGLLDCLRAFGRVEVGAIGVDSDPTSPSGLDHKSARRAGGAFGRRRRSSDPNPRAW